MAGTLVVDTVKTSTTSAPVFQNTSGTQMGTLCRAWVNFAGATGTINSSFNVSSVTRVTTGYYTVTMTNAPSSSDSNFSAVFSVGPIGSGNTNSIYESGTRSTTTVTFSCNAAGSAFDPTYGSVAIFR